MNEITGNSRFVIDAGRGRFNVQAFAGGLLSFAGHDPFFAVRRYGGEIRFADDGRTVESMLVVARAESIALVDDVGEKDRRELERALREEVLETADFPEIFFVSKDVSLAERRAGVFIATAHGALSLHGRTQPLTIAAEVSFGNGLLYASGEFHLRQSDFEIERVTAFGGTLKVKDEVVVSFDLVAAGEPAKP
ncbi:MAG: YceI family protein [Acidobacteria bacterium]|nr:YceI family protein [Acidobacteriota bacterium]